MQTRGQNGFNATFDFWFINTLEIIACKECAYYYYSTCYVVVDIVLV